MPVSVQSASTESDNTSTQQAPATIGRQTELITEDQRIRYTYDTHGRMLYKTTEPFNEASTQPKKALHLQYNANNEVVKSLTREYQGNNVKQICTRYHYDAFGRRIAKHSDIRQMAKDGDTLKAINKPTCQHTHMLWDGDRLIQEYSDTHVFTTVYDQASFAPVVRLVWLREHLIHKHVSEQDKEWLTKFNDKERETRVNLREIPSFYDDYAKKDKLDDITSIKVYYYHNDQLGTPNELTNQDGEVVWLADFEAWGRIAKEKYNAQRIGGIEISEKELQPIRFQAQSFDVETGLHYNRYRYYDNDMGMFISRDPIGLIGGDNVFAYAPNPTGWIDPLGLVTREDAIRSLKNDPNVQPDIPATPRHGRTPGKPARYSLKQINKRWFSMYEADISRHLKAGNMLPCPLKNNNICTNCDGSEKWRKYVGDSTVYHCGFDGYLENRIPNVKNPAPINECFYDHSGNLVSKGHIDYGCRGTPDYYPSFASPLDHYFKDPGGPPGPSSSDKYKNISEESKVATNKFYLRNPEQNRLDHRTTIMFPSL